MRIRQIRSTYKNQKRFQDVEELTSGFFVACLNRLADDSNHAREQGLEGSLLPIMSIIPSQRWGYHSRVVAFHPHRCTARRHPEIW